MKSQVDRGMSHQLKMMSISLNKTNKKLDALISLITPKEEMELDDGECSVCGTTAPRMSPNLMK